MSGATTRPCSLPDILSTCAEALPNAPRSVRTNAIREVALFFSCGSIETSCCPFESDRNHRGTAYEVGCFSAPRFLGV